MEHVVFFPAPDGSPAFRRVASLEDAVALVEHLRNVEGVASVSVHALTEVPLAFRAYYKVEVPAGVQGTAVDVPAQASSEPRLEPVAEPVVEPVAAEREPVLVAVPSGDAQPEPAHADGSRRDGRKSLGFFA